MSNEQQVREYYFRRTGELDNLLRPMLKKRKQFGWLRLVTGLISLVILWFIFSDSNPILLLPFLIAGTLFLFIVHLDLGNQQKIRHTTRIKQIVEQELKIRDHQFSDLPDGREFSPDHHDYSGDLDIFGKASLFQYCNRAQTEQGRMMFGRWLLEISEPGIVRQRQEAVRELSGKPEWRQELQAYCSEENITIRSEKKITGWLREPLLFDAAYWNVLRLVLPALILTCLVLHIAGIFSAIVFYPSVVIAAILSFSISRKILPVYRKLNKISGEVSSLAGSAAHIETEQFKSNHLLDLQHSFRGKQFNASRFIREFKKILDRFDYRLNPLVFIPLNIFLFWDLQQILLLEEWKKKNKEFVENCFRDLAVLECLSSLATLYFNHPGWCLPEISDQKGFFSAEDLGHPLIRENKLVRNSFTSPGIHQMNIVTGSNMSGKSTFLRAVGVNIVLAMTGGPVCAARMELYPLRVISNMRVTDNLEENTSTFYAELKKLKRILDDAIAGREIFILLDEILRGTNSHDRQTGSMALVKQLLQYPVSGILATHDLELATMAKDFPDRIHNYHFDVQVENQELYFDYRLKTGICTSMNASILMKKIGIQL